MAFLAACPNINFWFCDCVTRCLILDKYLKRILVCIGIISRPTALALQIFVAYNLKTLRDFKDLHFFLQL